MGVDVARYGADATALLVRDASTVVAVERRSGLSTMETAGRVLALARDHDVGPRNIAIDDTGLGAGVSDRLIEQGFAVQPVNAASRPQSPLFANRRAEVFWRLREALNPDSQALFSIPQDHEDLIHELSEITYGFDSRGRIRIEAKDAIRSRLGTSPDIADACALSFAPSLTPPSEPRAWNL